MAVDNRGIVATNGLPLQIFWFTDHHEIGASGKIHHRFHQGFIHGQQLGAESTNARLIPNRLTQGAAQHDGGIFHGVVRINLDVAFCLHRQIKAAVGGKGREHMIKKWQARRNIAASCAIQIDDHGNLRFRRGPLGSPYAVAHRLLLSSRRLIRHYCIR